MHKTIRAAFDVLANKNDSYSMPLEHRASNMNLSVRPSDREERDTTLRTSDYEAWGFDNERFGAAKASSTTSRWPRRRRRLAALANGL